jgi:hypothetical protein
VITAAFQKEQIRKLADDVHQKILAKEKLLEGADGPLVIKATPKGKDFEIRLNVTA